MNSKRLKILDYIEISVTKKGAYSSIDKSQIADFFYSSHGFNFADMIFEERRSLLRGAVYVKSYPVVDKLHACFKKWKSKKGFRFSSKLLERNDWYDKWHASFTKMPLGKLFSMVPEWESGRKIPGSRIIILMDPKGAFGSGQHPTTQIMIGLMEQLKNRKIESFFDVGAGTGVLSVVASKLWNPKIECVEKDPQSIESVKFNLRLNEVPNAKVLKEDFLCRRAAKKYDLVCANVLSTVLLQGREKLYKSVKRGQYLAISGIHLVNFEEVKNAYRLSGLRCLKIIKKRGWAGMLFKRG